MMLRTGLLFVSSILLVTPAFAQDVKQEVEKVC
jgi:hypothetical protein